MISLFVKLMKFHSLSLSSNPGFFQYSSHFPPGSPQLHFFITVGGKNLVKQCANDFKDFPSIASEAISHGEGFPVLHVLLMRTPLICTMWFHPALK